MSAATLEAAQGTHHDAQQGSMSHLHARDLRSGDVICGVGPFRLRAALRVASTTTVTRGPFAVSLTLVDPHTGALRACLTAAGNATASLTHAVSRLGLAA